MSYFQRIRSAVIGVLFLLFAVVMFIIPDDVYELIAFVLSILLLIYGFRLLWYYFTMARRMVGGKSSLYQAVIVLDAALVTITVATASDAVILAYLLFIYAFAGFVDVMRAVEAKNVGSPRWKLKLIGGVLQVLFAVALVIVGLILHHVRIVVYGYCLSLVYSGVTRIINAFRRTAIVYIQ